MKSRRYIFVWLLLMFHIHSKAQLFAARHFKFRSYTSRDGLIHNFTRKCRLDEKGFLWVITQNGLSRFDGYSFTNFQHIPGDTTSLPFNDLSDIDIDNKGRIWLGYATGLCYYDPAIKKFMRVPAVEQAVTLIYDKKNDAVWFCSNEKGLQKIALASMQVQNTRLTGHLKGTPLCLGIDPANQLWIGIEREDAIRYNTATGNYLNIPATNWIRSFDTDNENNFWISSWWEGMRKFNSTTDSSQRLDLSPYMNGSNPIFQGVAQSMALTGPDVLWMITHNRGLILFDKKKNQFLRNIRYDASQRSGLLSDYSSSIYTDRYGITWICSWFGLTRINPDEQQFQSAEIPELQTDSYNLLSGIMDDPIDKNTVWLSVTGLGLAKYDRLKQKIVRWYYNNPDADYDWVWPTNFVKDSAGRIWLPGYGGLILIEKGRVSRHEIKWNGRYTYPNGGLLGKDGMIWLWTDEGLVFFDPEKKNYTLYRKPATYGGNAAFGQLQQYGNALYMASDRGLFRFDLVTKTFTLITIPGSGNKFRALVLIGDRLFAGGETGLFEYDLRSGKSTHIGEKEGIISLIDGSLLADHSRQLWIYALNGLFRLDPATGEIKKFTVTDGIYNNSNDKAQLFFYRDDIYIGYRMAYTRFDPSRVEVNNNSVTPFITDIQVNNKPTLIVPENFNTTSFKLAAKENNITISYTGIDYTNADRVNFAYQLVGFDKDWVQAGTKRSVTYSNLRGGNYVFKLKAANSRGNWNESVAVFKFYLTPPLLQRWWVKLLLVALILALFYAIYKRRVRHLRKQQKERTYRQQLEIDRYKQELELEQIGSFFSETLINTNNTNRVLNEVAKNLIGKLGFEDCMIYLWNEDRTKLMQVAGYGFKGEVENLASIDKYHIEKGKGIIGASVASGKALIVNDTSKDERYINADNKLRRSELCVPLMDEGEAIGAINIEQSDKDHFTPYHLQIVSTIATMVVNKLKAIETAQSLHQKELELSQTSRQLAETELAMLRSQMNPHFIFNSLNSVQKYIWENKEEDAAEYLASFAKLMRAILENSRKSLITVREEVDTMKIYTELENRRSNGRFDYTIRITEDVEAERTMIPPMLLQPFIENAVWHGLSKKEGKGHLAVLITQQNGSLICTVEDDGVGRTETDSFTNKKSLGISITRKRIEQLMQGSDQQPTLEIVDKKQDGRPVGTKVIITLPLQIV